MNPEHAPKIFGVYDMQGARVLALQMPDTPPSPAVDTDDNYEQILRACIAAPLPERAR